MILPVYFKGKHLLFVSETITVIYVEVRSAEESIVLHSVIQLIFSIIATFSIIHDC